MSNLSPIQLFARLIVLVTAIPIHESAHAYVAYRLGDPTAKNMGRLSLNPMAHFDLKGSICMMLFGIGWAKPVPINRYNFSERKKGMALSAARGPISNIIVAFFSMMLYKVVYYTYFKTGFGWLLTLVTLFRLMCSINISLAIFNLIPIPPFDGSRIFYYFMDDRTYFKIMEYEQIIFFALLISLYIGIFDRPLSFFNGILFTLLNRLTFFVDIIFRAILY